jgi:hypothetical protein
MLIAKSRLQAKRSEIDQNSSIYHPYKRESIVTRIRAEDPLAYLLKWLLPGKRLNDEIINRILVSFPWNHSVQVLHSFFLSCVEQEGIGSRLCQLSLQQTNESDSGVYLLYNAYCISHGIDPRAGSLTADQWRPKWATEIILPESDDLAGAAILSGMQNAGRPGGPVKIAISFIS